MAGGHKGGPPTPGVWPWQRPPPPTRGQLCRHTAVPPELSPGHRPPVPRQISLVATAEEGQRSAPKSQILSMLKQRLTDLRADNARQVERWTAAEQRLAEVQVDLAAASSASAS